MHSVFESAAYTTSLTRVLSPHHICKYTHILVLQLKPSSMLRTPRLTLEALACARTCSAVKPVGQAALIAQRAFQSSSRQLFIPGPAHTLSNRTFFSSSFCSKQLESSSQAWKQGKLVTYEELKPWTEQPTGEILLIDVREPDEVMMGNIPSSVNLPLSTMEKALSMDEGDFARVNGFRKPEKDHKIVFYCRSGARSQTASEIWRGALYQNVRNYKGSYLDWVAKNEKSRDDGED